MDTFMDFLRQQMGVSAGQPDGQPLGNGSVPVQALAGGSVGRTPPNRGALDSSELDPRLLLLLMQLLGGAEQAQGPRRPMPFEPGDVRGVLGGQ